MRSVDWQVGGKHPKEPFLDTKHRQEFLAVFETIAA